MLERKIIKIEAKLNSKKLKEKFKRKYRESDWYLYSFAYHPNHKCIGTSGMISERELKDNYFKLEGVNQGKDVYMEREKV